ncbi:hypothetical protein D3C71_1113320 [compost metagenome]
MVHAQEDGAQFGAGDGTGVGAAVHAFDVLHGYGFHHVHLARKQGGHTGRIVADGGENDFADVAFDLAPVAAVACKHRAHVGLALTQAEGARAVGTERGGVLDALAAVHRAQGLVGLAPLLAHHVHERDHIRQDREGGLGFDFDRVVVDLAHFLEVVGVALHVRAFHLGAPEAEHHVIGRERGAVVELHALAQLETPHGGRRLLPARRQGRRQAQVLVAADQRLIDVAGDAQLQRLIERVGVHRQRVTLVGDADGLSLGHQARRRQRGKESGQSDFFMEFHGNLQVGESGVKGLGRWRGSANGQAGWTVLQAAAKGMACSIRLACSAEPRGRMSSLKS